MGMIAGMMRKELVEKGQEIWDFVAYERLAKAWEFKSLPMIDNFSWLKLGGVGERALTGKALWEPLGSSRSFLGFGQLMFLPAQMARLPLADTKGIRTRQVIGPRARRPLEVDTPILLAAIDLASVTTAAKLSLARAAAAVGTAVNSGETDFRKLVDRLRAEGDGVPVGLKIGAGNIEADLEVALEAGFDVVTIDGGQGGTGYGPEMTINNFGVPTVYAIPRARRFLDEHHSDMTLIATGGLRDSGDFLKAMALGADAVAVGEAALAALIYPSWTRIPAWESPLHLIFLGGKHLDQFDATQGAQGVANFLKASTEELALAAQTIGQEDVRDIGRNGLVALTKEVAEVTGVKLAYYAPATATTATTAGVMA